jgi:Flp pilus assembly protein TadD
VNGFGTEKASGTAFMLSWITSLWRTAVMLLLTVGVVASAGMFSDVTGRNKSEAKTGSLFGSYLAGRQARIDRDTGSAAAFYENALEKDPGNEIILEQTFLLEAAAANWSRATSLGKRVLKTDKAHRVARVVLGVVAFKNGDLAEATKHFDEAKKGPISDLTTNLSKAWVDLAAKRPDKAFKTLGSMKRADWALFYRHYHKGLIADLARKRSTAADWIAEAYARHAAYHGDLKLAGQILRTHISSAATHPVSEALLADIKKRKKIPLLAGDAAQGMAEVYYGIGDALTGEGGVEIGTIYLQLALYLKPDFPLALRSLGEVHDAGRNYHLAIDAYDRVAKTSPIWMNVQIRKAYNLNSLEKTDEAVALLERLQKASPGQTRPLDALGSILRSHKRYKEAADAYARAINLVPKPTKQHWGLFYARGVSYERLNLWPKAEADLQKALELSPDQPLVLNYLGYSWVDQGRYLKKAMDLIRRAVELKPSDGYFVDSLGWAHYRLGNFPEAVKKLERAVELRPDDPVINDHLGDAYWRVGRRLEARYQWSQSLTLEPEKDEAEKTKLKLEKGLDAVSDKKAVARDSAAKAK